MTTEAKLKTWKIDAGNSSTGPCGFVVYNLRAATKEEALQKARETFAVPESITDKGEDDDGNRTTVIAYLNASALTLDDIEEVEDEDD